MEPSWPRSLYMSSSSERAPPGCYWTALPRRPGPVSGRTGARRNRQTNWTNRPICLSIYPHFIGGIQLRYQFSVSYPLSSVFTHSVRPQRLLRLGCRPRPSLPQWGRAVLELCCGRLPEDMTDELSLPALFFPQGTRECLHEEVSVFQKTTPPPRRKVLSLASV